MISDQALPGGGDVYPVSTWYSAAPGS